MSTLERPHSDSGGRTVLLVGIVVAVIGVAALIGGGFLVGAHATQRDGDGFYSTEAHALSTPTRALVSEQLDVRTGGSDWFFRKGRLATLRVTATGTGGKPIFVGVARSAQLSAYLRGVAHDEITDFEVDPFSVKTVRRAGAAALRPPTHEHIWAASASGNGRQAVRWGVRKGTWGVVVMNADGSAHVATELSVGAKVPLILWLGIGLLSVGAFVSLGGGGAIYAARTRRKSAPASVVASAYPGGES